MDFSSFWERQRFIIDDRINSTAMYILRTGRLPNHKDQEIAMSIKANIRDALASAIEEGTSELAISGPKICLKDRYRHFYEVHLDGERVEVSGSSLPDGFSYLLESELDYAERLIIDHLATLTEGRIGRLIAEIARRSDSRPLPSDSRILFKVWLDDITEIGSIGYFPAEKIFKVFRIRNRLTGEFRYALNEKLEPCFDSLQEATEALLEAAE